MLGERDFGADGRQVYEEGLNIPTHAAGKKGKFSEIIFSIIRANVRNPVEVEGDLYSLASMK